MSESARFGNPGRVKFGFDTGAVADSRIPQCRDLPQRSHLDGPDGHLNTQGLIHCKEK